MGQRLFKGTLARTSIDGSPRPLMENVRDADWSPDGATMSIVHDQGSKDVLEYPVGTALYETDGYLSEPRVSPDGARIAFMEHSTRFDDRGWVKVVDRNKHVMTLAGEFRGEEGLAWAPDGATLLFGADEPRSGHQEDPGDLAYQIYTVAAARPGQVVSAFTSPGDYTIHDIAADGRWLVTRDDLRDGVGAHLEGDKTDRDLTWLNRNWAARLSRDGTRLLFGDGHAGGNYGVVWRPTDNSPIVRLGVGNPIDWSPDESWVLAWIPSPLELVLYPMGTGEPIHLKRGTLAQYQWSSWFPDGKSLLVFGNEKGKPTRGYRQVIPDGEPTPVLPEGITPVTITRDGKTVLAIDRDQKWRWHPLDGGPPREAAGMRSTDGFFDVLGWSPDGAQLFVRNGSDVPVLIDRLDVATGRRTPLAEVGPVDRTGILTFDVSNISKNGAQYSFTYWQRLSTLFVVTPTR
jgi:dipeptidyl aminopeptidase/acylaminoacyl peptidase